MRGRLAGRLSAIFLAGCALAACQPTSDQTGAVGVQAPTERRVSTSATPSDALREQAYVLGRDFAFAQQIARTCRRYDLARGVKRAVNGRIAELTEAEGVSDRDVIRAIEADDGRARLQRDLFAWIERRDVVIGVPESFCRAGDAERAEGTAIGRYLR